MLASGMFFDENTNCYYVNERYYNPILNKYMDGVDNVNLYETENPYRQMEDGISLCLADDSHALATAWANQLLSSSSFGTPISSYTSSWYSGLSDVEVLTRAIYCEGGTAYTDEGSAVALVILNRIHSSSFPNTPAAVVKQSGQFASITGTSSSTLKYNGNAIERVYVLGYGSVSSFNTLFNNYSPTAYSRNIYYNYQ